MDYESDASFLQGRHALPADEGCHAEFHLHPVLHKARSREAGRDIFEDRLYIRILAKGQPKTGVDRPATDQDKARFPRQWAAFRNQEVAPVVGTPVSHLPGLSPSRVKELEALHIRTVEDLAGLGDNALGNLGYGARELRAKAQQWLQGSGALAQSAQLQSEVDELKQQLAQALARIDEMSASQAGRKGKRVPAHDSSEGVLPAGDPGAERGQRQH